MTTEIEAPCTFVYFDAGYTILRPEPSVGHHYSALARKYACETNPRRLDSCFGVAWKAARNHAFGNKNNNTGTPAYGRTIAEARSFWTKVIQSCFESAGYSSPTDPQFYIELFDLFADASCWKLYDDVLPAFDLLDSRGVAFGILSNWDSRLHSILTGLKISERLSATILSSEAGYEKPHPSIFKVAARALSADHARSIGLIGDEACNDGAGAVAAGWRQCLVVRDDWKPYAEVNLQVRPNLTAAVDVLTRAQ